MRNPNIRKHVIGGMIKAHQDHFKSNDRSSSVASRSLAGSIERDNQRSLDELYEDLDLHQKRGPEKFGYKVMLQSMNVPGHEKYRIRIKNVSAPRDNPVRANPSGANVKRRNPAKKPMTVDQFNDKFLSALIAYDKREEKSEAKRGGRANIYRLGILLGSLGKVREDVKGFETSSSDQALITLRAAISQHFHVSTFYPARKIYNMIAIQLGLRTV